MIYICYHNYSTSYCSITGDVDTTMYAIFPSPQWCVPSGTYCRVYYNFFARFCYSDHLVEYIPFSSLSYYVAMIITSEARIHCIPTIVLKGWYHSYVVVYCTIAVILHLFVRKCIAKNEQLIIRRRRIRIRRDIIE